MKEVIATKTGYLGKLREAGERFMVDDDLKASWFEPVGADPKAKPAAKEADPKAKPAAKEADPKAKPAAKEADPKAKPVN